MAANVERRIWQEKVSKEVIDFYCKKCGKSLKISYIPKADENAPIMNGISIRCHTHKCTRVMTLKNFTIDQLLKRTDARGRCYL